MLLWCVVFWPGLPFPVLPAPGLIYAVIACPVLSAPFLAYRLPSGLSCPVCTILSGPSPVLFSPVLSCPVASFPVTGPSYCSLACRPLSWLILSCPVLSLPVLSGCVLSCRVVLSCTTFCPGLPSRSQAYPIHIAWLYLCLSFRFLVCPVRPV